MRSPARAMEWSDADARLRGLERIAAELGANPLARDARELAERVVAGRFYVACVGQFKRGKSTLLNALVGREILPTGVVPVTSAVTVLRGGAEIRAHVAFEDGRVATIPPERIREYVSEAENPENRKGVRAVEVVLPAPLLATGMCLVDTPGLGSVFGGNAAVTRAFVPHIDAALVVIGADPPLSGEELAVVEEVAAQVRTLVFVLNKADRLTPEERAEGARFAAQVVSRRLQRPIGTVHEVSATERLALGTATRGWSGLEHAVSTLAREAGADLVRLAEARGVTRMGRALLDELSERRDALVRPLADSERRLAALRRSVDGSAQALSDLGVLLGAEQNRLVAEFRARHDARLASAQQEARSELERRVRALEAPRSQLRRAAFRVAAEVARDSSERFRLGLEPAAAEMYRRATSRFVALANDFLHRLRASGEAGLERLPEGIDAEPELRTEGRLYYTDLMYRTMSPLGWALDLMRARKRATTAILRRVGGYLDALVEANGSRVANDVAERVAQSRTALERQLRTSLGQVTEVAERAMEVAQARRAEGERAVTVELARIEELRGELERLLRGQPTGEVT